MKLGCIVMASGAGARFRAAGGAGHKLLAPVAGPSGTVPLVVQTAGGVPGGLFEVAVVTWLPEVAEVIRASGLPASLVFHQAEEQPPRSATTRAGATHAGARGWEGVLYLPGDQPLVRRESFCALAAAFEADPSRAYRLGWEGEPASPVLFPARCIPALMDLRGSDGGARLLRGGAYACGIVEAREPCELIDVDVPADLARVASALSKRT